MLEVARELLKKVDKDNMDISIVRDGLPKLRGIDFIHLSLAHTRGFICAIASIGSIGLDCEHARSFSPTLIGRFTNRTEMKGLGEENDDALLTRIWCAKEAVSKALGLGLKLDLREIKLSREGKRWFADLDRSSVRFALKFKSKDDIIIAIARSIADRNAQVD